MWRVLLLLQIILLFFSLEMKGDIYTTPNKHVIISFDTALPDKYRECLFNRNLIQAKLQSVIDELDLTDGD